MKKIIFTLAAAALVFASCQKAEVSAPASNDFQLNITVADLGSDNEPATKAMIKTLWTKNDTISIWYDANYGVDPDLVIVYDGSNWNKAKNVTLSGNEPSEGTSKYLKALYNDQVVVASKDSYIFKNNTLTFDIKSWNFLSEIQVVIMGITEDPANFTLACDKFTPIEGYTVAADTITAITGLKAATAIGFESEVNPGCATFKFATADYSAAEQNFLFTLTDTKEPLATRIVKGYSVNQTLTEGTSQIKGIKMESADFQESVKFSADGPEWAYSNVGAESGTDYGYYFAWGYDYGCVRKNNGWVLVSNNSTAAWFFTHNYNYYNYYCFPNLSATQFKDAATKAWTNLWRMPTDSEFKELIQNCKVEYVFNTTGVKGIKVIGKDSYSANSIFLPAAGYGNSASLTGDGTQGLYWTSTEYSTNNGAADYLGFTNNVVAPVQTDKYYGLSIRPVRATYVNN